jgi:type IV secretory pathway TrbD component
MTAIDAIIFCFIPLAIERIIDPELWAMGKDDKPITTIIRGLLIAVITLHLYFTYGVNWYATPVACVAWYALFDPWINQALNKHMMYHPNRPGWDGWWYRRTARQWIRLRFIWLIGGLALFIVLKQF